MSNPQQHKNGRLTSLAIIAVLGACLAALAGCGGSSAPKAASTPETAAAVSTTATSGMTGKSTAPDVGTAKGKGKQSQQATEGSEAGNTKQKQGGDTVQKVTAPATQGAGETGTRGGPQSHPCTLVGLSVAQSITGGRVAAATEAPLGPTCIYRLAHPKADITLAVESMSFSQVTHQMSTRKSVTVGGRQAYCGKLGAQMLFVPLSKGHLLNVTAPCPVAQQFAEHALSRLVS